MDVPEDVLGAIREAAGPGGWIDDAPAMEPYLIEERGLYRGTCAAVVRPASTKAVADVVRLCAQAGVPVVPQGGNTGLVGGGVPDGGIVLSTARLDRILEYAQAALREAPPALLEVKSPGRDRTLRDLAYHVFRVAAAFVDCLEQERFLAEWFAEPAPPDTQTGERLAEHGGAVRERLGSWFAAAPKGCYETMAQTYYGEQRVHDLLERTTWHAGQHVRQVYSLLEDNGEAPTVALDPGVFRGLPLPEQMW